MKASQLRPCEACWKPLGVSFFRIEAHQEIVRVRDAEQQIRTEGAMKALFPGSPGLARVFSGDPELTEAMVHHTIVLCMNCAISASEGFSLALARAMEKASGEG